MATDTPSGFAQLSDKIGEFNQQAFIIEQFLSRVHTAWPVMVLKCTNSGAVSAPGTVDVQPLVMLIDNNGKTYSRAPIYGLPFFRVLGGGNAVILDPQPNDIGLAIFASRDVSKVKSSKKESPPGTKRTHSPSDGFYLGGFLSPQAISQYIQFSTDGIKIVSSGTVAIESSSLTHNGVNVGATHVHGGVQSGSSNTQVPH